MSVVPFTPRQTDSNSDTAPNLLATANGRAVTVQVRKLLKDHLHTLDRFVFAAETSDGTIHMMEADVNYGDGALDIASELYEWLCDG